MYIMGNGLMGDSDPPKIGYLIGWYGGKVPPIGVVPIMTAMGTHPSEGYHTYIMWGIINHPIRGGFKCVSIKTLREGVKLGAIDLPTPHKNYHSPIDSGFEFRGRVWRGTVFRAVWKASAAKFILPNLFCQTWRGLRLTRHSIPGSEGSQNCSART